MHTQGTVRNWLDSTRIKLTHTYGVLIEKSGGMICEKHSPWTHEIGSQYVQIIHTPISTVPTYAVSIAVLI